MGISADPKYAIPYNTVEDEDFAQFFYPRAKRVREEMEPMYWKVSQASRDILRVDHYPGGEDFIVYVCPVKAMRNKEMVHPVLLTICKWSTHTQMLYWPLDMIPLTDEERHDIWYNFVQNDEMYFNLGDSPF